MKTAIQFWTLFCCILYQRTYKLVNQTLCSSLGFRRMPTLLLGSDFELMHSLRWKIKKKKSEDVCTLFWKIPTAPLHLRYSPLHCYTLFRQLYKQTQAHLMWYMYMYKQVKAYCRTTYPTTLKQVFSLVN